MPEGEACDCRRGAYQAAHRTSDKQCHVRANLAVREVMVRTRARYISLISALLRRDGFRIKQGTSRSFLLRLEALSLSTNLTAKIAPLIVLIEKTDFMQIALVGCVDYLYGEQSLQHQTGYVYYICAFNP